MTYKTNKRLVEEFYDEKATTDMKLARIFEVLMELRTDNFGEDDE